MNNDRDLLPARTQLHPKTKEWFDSMLTSKIGQSYWETMRRLGPAVNVVANALADAIEQYHPYGSWTAEEEDLIVANIRSGGADQYIAGLLGYV